jgi:hypothetical protein
VNVKSKKRHRKLPSNTTFKKIFKVNNTVKGAILLIYSKALFILEHLKPRYSPAIEPFLELNLA